MKSLGIVGVFLLLGSCAPMDSTSVKAPDRVNRDAYTGVKCQTEALVVDLILPLKQKAVCEATKDRSVCHEVLVQLHVAGQEKRSSFLLLDRNHRTNMTYIEDVLSSAHNSKRNIKISYIPEDGARCESVVPVLEEKDIVSLEQIS